jgi:hypothetical protein
VIVRWPPAVCPDDGHVRPVDGRALRLFDVRVYAFTYIADVTEEGLRDRRGRPPLGVAGILGQDPFTPIPLDTEPPPRAHASKQTDVDRFVADEEEFNDAYRRSVEARRKAERDRQLFPIGSFPPASPFVRGR